MSEINSINVEYRDIPNFPGYRVGDDGSVWSCLESHGQSPATIGTKWKRMKPSVDKRPKTKGRTMIILRQNGVAVPKNVPRLVIESFIGPCPKGMECAHWDGNPANNKLENLRYTTRKDNHADKIRHGTTNRGERNGGSKISEEDVRCLLKMVESKLHTKTSIARKFNLHIRTLYNILEGKAWNHVTGLPRKRKPYDCKT